MAYRCRGWCSGGRAQRRDLHGQAVVTMPSGGGHGRGNVILINISVKA